MSDTTTLTHEQMKAEVAMRIALDRYLTSLGWPPNARDLAGEMVRASNAGRSALFGGQSAPDAEELAASIFATERGAQLKSLVEEYLQEAAETVPNSKDEQLARLADLPPRQRLNEARRLGLIP